MRHVAATCLLLAGLVLGHVFVLGKAADARKKLPDEQKQSVVLPPAILRITALEFKGMFSDFLFLKSIVFLGGTFERETLPRIREEEWLWLHDVLRASVELDPYFLDPYYLANTQLTWDGNMVRETNALLEKGERFRSWDWSLPFYRGFNHFYFLQEKDQAAEALMESAGRPHAPPFVSSLAARMAYEGNRTLNAIAFLEEIIRTVDDPAIKKEYLTRLEALRAIAFLEAALASYRETFDNEPSSIQDLQKKGIITMLPDDPYGGDFFLDADGSVKTTSELRHVGQTGGASAGDVLEVR